MTRNTETTREAVAEIETLISEYDPKNSDWYFRRTVIRELLARLSPAATSAEGDGVREAWEAWDAPEDSDFLTKASLAKSAFFAGYRAALAPSASAAMNAARIYEYNRTRRWYRHEAACSSPEVENAQEVDVLSSTWECQVWGCVTSPADTTNVVCPDCEVVIAADLPISVAEHIVKQHNDALVKSAATENIDKQLAEARKALQPFAEAIAPDADTISGWRFGIKPKHVDFVRAYRVYASLADAPETATSSAEELEEQLDREFDAVLAVFEKYTPDDAYMTAITEASNLSKTFRKGELRYYGNLGVIREAKTALDLVRGIIVEAALTGFNCHEGDWAERLYTSQADTHAAVKSCDNAIAIYCRDSLRREDVSSVGSVSPKPTENTKAEAVKELVERLSDFMSKYIIGIGHFDGSEMTQEWNKLVTPAIEQVKTSVIIPDMHAATVQPPMKE